MYKLVRSSWDEDPEKRPDFKKIEITLGKIVRYLLNKTLGSHQ